MEVAMLILNREKYQSIVIGDEITVTVMRIRRDKVWLGIVFPKNVPVHRQEVYDAIHGRSAISKATTYCDISQLDVDNLQPDFVVECRIVVEPQG
jgi:carbon storage regulator